MMDPLEIGSTVTIKVENILWPKRHLYASGVVGSQYNYYTGTIMREKWFKPDEVGITTGNPSFPFRRIRRERIIAVNGAGVVFSPPPKVERIEKVVEGSKGNTYTVIKEGSRATCTCPGYSFRKTCKHLEMV
jgi:hypothetical protein